MTHWQKGSRNLITDVAGLAIGNASDGSLKSGVTALLCEEPSIAAFQVLGGAPGTRETDLLEPHNLVETVDALILSGGSAFGLDAASGAQAALAEMGRGFKVGPYGVPIVPAAILSDLLNGGDKNWGRYSPYRDLGYTALRAAGPDFELGSHGAGSGALTADLKGGLGSASAIIRGRQLTVGALVAVNPAGTTTIAGTPHFWAAPFEMDGEFGGMGLPHPMPSNAYEVRLKFAGEDDRSALTNTTIAVIATDAVLTKAECKRLAISAHDGFARAIWPCHTPVDGDLVFAVATGRGERPQSVEDFIHLGAAAAATMARAIARGVFAASVAERDVYPVWTSRR